VKLPLSVVLLAITTTAQNSIPIRGTVIDAGTHAPIPGAQVRLASYPASANILIADGAGKFEFQAPPGSKVSVSVSATGYSQSAVARTLQQGESQIQIQIALNRVVDLKGRLVDDQSGKPIAGLRVEVITRNGLEPANRTGLAGRAENSSPDGGFHFDDLFAGEYFLRISSLPAPALQAISAKELAGENRAKALQSSDGELGYGIVIWPGGTADIPESSGITITSGTMDIGDIRLTRSTLHDVAGELISCDEGASLQVMLLRKRGDGTARMATLDTECGAGFRVLNLPEGSLTLAAIQGGPPRRFASMPIDARARGSLALNLARMVSVQMLLEVGGAFGRDFPADLTSTRFEIQAESAPVRIDAPDKLSSSEFEAHVFPGERYRLSAQLPPNYYVKQFSYSGVSSEDVTGFTAADAPLSTLRIVLSNRAGILEARGPLGGQILLVREGASFAEARLSFKAATRDGKATFTNLRPGKYFVFMTPGAAPDSQASLDEYLRHSTAVTIEEGQRASVALDAP